MRRLGGEGLGRGVSSPVIPAAAAEAWSEGGVAGEGRDEKVLERGVPAVVLALSSSSA